MSLALVQPKLFGDDYPDAPPTEGIKYAGSKLKLLPQILWLAEKTNAKSVFDGFSGSTRVSQALARTGYRVISNDQAVWSEVLGRCYLQAGKKTNYEKLVRQLNDCKPVDGWFTKFYGGETEGALIKEGDAEKRPWQIHNTRKLDGIREEIDRLQLDPAAQAVALTSLMLALDQVDSTMGHFSSYLREWSPRSYKKMYLQVPDIIDTALSHEVRRGDIFAAAVETEADLAYYDPPYGSNNEKMPPSRVRYSAYYHVWTTICLNDKPELFGKVNRRADTRDTVAASIFEEFRQDKKGKFLAVEAIHKLIRQTQTKYIVLSYSSGGRATATELNEAMNDAGDLLEVIEVDYRKNVMAGMTWTNEWLRDAEEPNREFLFLLKRR
jgi:adenine-specific DNA-methyltransferase